MVGHEQDGRAHTLDGGAQGALDGWAHQAHVIRSHYLKWHGTP